jgi:class 3 adenylate cyclase/tetratricopeptide (TPR) repeat protein
VEEPAGPPLRAGEERRIISALFTDLVDFTAHTAASDPEDVRIRLTAYHRRCREDIERFGGRVQELLGDGVFAVFGSPVSHEDDPERAIRAALRIQESVEQLNAEQPDLVLSVRAAVTTGEALVQLEPQPDRVAVVGDVVNTAARLEQHAPPGGVVVDERTYLSARRAIEFSEREPVAVKGKVEPIPIWQAEASRSRFGVAVEEGAGSLFVGRSAELNMLTEAFERTLARRSPQMVTIVGEPGVGKTRLVRELRRHVDERPDLVWWREGRCLPYGEGVTFWALSEVVKAQAGILEGEPVDEAAEKLRVAIESLVDDPDDADWLRLRLAPLAGTGDIDISTERGELFSAWLRFLEALAQRNPLVLVLEDLQWADRVLLEFVEYVLDWADDAPILLVGTARPELFTDYPDWGGGKRDAATLSLPPLDPQETAELLMGLAGKSVMPAQTQQALLERSGGNPLYVTELMRLVAEQGTIDFTEEAGLPLPDTVQAIIAARLDLLDDEHRAMLQVASVIGRVFWAGALGFLGAGDAEAISSAVRVLVARELIRPVRRSSMKGQDEYTFAHVLIRDVAYGQLTRPERARLHLEVARWLEATSGERVLDVAELVAHHHLRALELEPTEDDQRLNQVYRFVMMAGERVQALDADRGSFFYSKAAELARTPRDRGRALLAYGQIAAGHIDEGAQALEEAAAAFREAEAPLHEADALAARAGLEWYRGDADAADRYDELALTMVEGLEPSEIVARVIAGRAAHLQLRGRSEEGLEMADRAIAVAQLVGSTENYVRALSARANALLQLGDPSAEEDIRETLRISLDRNDARAALVAYNNLATNVVIAGRLIEGKELIEEAIEYGDQRGYATAADWSRNTRCEALFPLGEWDETLAVGRQLVEADQARGGSQISTFAMAWQAIVLFFRGSALEARKMWVDVLEQSRRGKDAQGLFPSLAMGVMIWEATGEATEARRMADEFAEISLDNPVFLAQHLPTIAEPMVLMGMEDQVEKLARFARPNSEWMVAQIGGAQARVAEARGNYDEALELYRSVVDVGAPLEQRFWTTYARIGVARCLVALGRDEEASDELNLSRADAKSMGAERLLDSIQEIAEPGREAVEGG